MEVKVIDQENSQIEKPTKMDGNESLVSETIATLKGIPTKEDLKHLLTQNVLVVSFTKLNGDRRDMTCTLREDIKPPATKTDPLSQKAVRETSDAVISVWDVNARGWRSFRYERVNSVEYVEEYEQEWFERK